MSRTSRNFYKFLTVQSFSATVTGIYKFLEPLEIFISSRYNWNLFPTVLKNMHKYAIFQHICMVETYIIFIYFRYRKLENMLRYQEFYFLELGSNGVFRHIDILCIFQGNIKIPTLHLEKQIKISLFEQNSDFQSRTSRILRA